MARNRTIKVEALTRVEGEGGLFVRLLGDQIEDVQLSIYEPPRLFEALLQGRPIDDVPDIVARICGICPVAYQMTAVHALELALGATITPEIRKLRRLLYCGEWIESHALHMHLLHAPDFLGFDGVADMARKFPDEVNRGLRLKKHGNAILEVLGGRAIHPVNVRVGGFYRAPSKTSLTALLPDLKWSLEAACEATKWVASLDFPGFERPYEMVALQHPDEYPMNEGRIATTSGELIDFEHYEQHFVEHQVPHSTALQSARAGTKTSYHVGPLARVNLNLDRLSFRARRLADEVGICWPCFNPFQSIVARGLEVVHAFEEAIEIIEQYEVPKLSSVPLELRAGSGQWATEAPRGLIYHHYEVHEDGTINTANIIPPTSQNQQQIEDDLRDWLPRILCDDESQTARDCERLVRCYDPCISCSTHFLKLTIDRSRNQTEQPND